MNLNRIVATTLGCLLAAGPLMAAPLDITFNFVGAQTAYTSANGSVIDTVDATPEQKAAFEFAATVWEGVITGYDDAVTWPLSTMQIDIEMTSLDGPSSTLAIGGPTDHYINGAFDVSNKGMVRLDADDWLGGPLGRNTLGMFNGTILHELAHVLGFGTLWSRNGAVDKVGRYVGANALAAYRAEFAPDAEFIPLSPDKAHWDECWDPAASTECRLSKFNDPELMTPYVLDAMTISATTIASIRDLGFTTIEPAAFTVTFPQIASVPVPAAGWLLLTAIGAGAVASRRRDA